MKTKTYKGRGCEAVAMCRLCSFHEQEKSATHRIDSLRGKVHRHVRSTGHSVEIHKTNWTLVKQIEA